MSETIFKVVAIQSVTQRVWYEVVGVVSAEQAIAMYREGKGLEVLRKFLTIDHSEVEDVYQEGENAVSMG